MLKNIVDKLGPIHAAISVNVNLGEQLHAPPDQLVNLLVILKLSLQAIHDELTELANAQPILGTFPVLLESTQVFIGYHQHYLFGFKVELHYFFTQLTLFWLFWGSCLVDASVPLQVLTNGFDPISEARIAIGGRRGKQEL